jgi:N-acetylglucosamine repressor
VNCAAMTPKPASLAEVNQSRIAQILHSKGILSRAQIAKQLNLTAPAISKLTGRMIVDNIVREVGDIPGVGNRRSIGLQLQSKQYKVIGVKFARSRIQIGCFDIAGNPLQLSEITCISDDSILEAVSEVQTRVQHALDRDPSIVSVGMAVPGPYLRNEGRIAIVTAMQGWEGINFRDSFSKVFSVPTFIEQDARAGVLAQSLFVPQYASANIAYYLIGEGVGLGVIEQGRLINGVCGGATELGHVSIDMNGRPCECGNKGCLERYCSAVAIHRMLCESPCDSYLPEAASLNYSQACQLLFHHAAQGDAIAKDLVEQIATYVGYGCVDIVNAFNPSHIIIGDIVASAGQPLLDRVNAIIAERALPELKNETHVCLSRLPTDATLMGAAAVAVNHFLSYPTYYAKLVHERQVEGGSNG